MAGHDRVVWRFWDDKYSNPQAGRHGKTDLQINMKSKLQLSQLPLALRSAATMHKIHPKAESNHA
ncbi:MAG: hypothetical protein AMJ53_08410 [Gammaproteobacteria bacterium SG8_11]|nr:MAG: hypothetical protein AMJ53_08410 [Gammaproteobacteria bacterium SG8_11]